MFTLWFPDLASNTMKYELLLRFSKIFSTISRIYPFFFVLFLNCMHSTHITSSLFSLQRTMLLGIGELDFRMIPASESCWRWPLASWYIAGCMHRGRCLKGVSSNRSMRCSVVVICPILVSVSISCHDDKSLFLCMNILTPSCCSSVNSRVTLNKSSSGWWSSGGVVVKLFACGARGPGFDYRSRRYYSRDWLCPASKSRYG